jgi:flagellar protein FlaG
MQVEANTITGTTLQQQPRAADSVDAGRRQLDRGQAESGKAESAAGKDVQSEEILNQIKALTEEGQYSVRFERNREFDELVVKIVDPQTDKVIRQVPAEEVLGVKASLAELQGKLVDTLR